MRSWGHTKAFWSSALVTNDLNMPCLRRSPLMADLTGAGACEDGGGAGDEEDCVWDEGGASDGGETLPRLRCGARACREADRLEGSIADDGEAREALGVRIGTGLERAVVVGVASLAAARSSAEDADSDAGWTARERMRLAPALFAMLAADVS